MWYGALLFLRTKSAKGFTKARRWGSRFNANCMRCNELRGSGGRHSNCDSRRCKSGLTAATSRLRNPGAKPAMAYKEIFWMACDSTEQLRAEYGPFLSRAEAELEAKKLGFGYLLRYEHLLDENEEIQEVRCIFIELAGGARIEDEAISVTLHTRCATCGESAAHDKGWQADVWADIHEFEHTRHRVRLFEHARGKGLKEIVGWRG
jgi:hypothetical protein